MFSDNEIAKVKNNIKKRLNYCKAIADDIIKYNATDDIIKYAKKWAEIESPMTKETEACWIRINWNDIYIFVHMDEKSYEEDDIVKFTGKVDYQLDMDGAYGTELIDVNSIDLFMEELDKLNLNNLDEDDIFFFNAVPKLYIPYCGMF